VLKTATSFKIDSQICLLGRKYTCDTQSPGMYIIYGVVLWKVVFAKHVLDQFCIMP